MDGEEPKNCDKSPKSRSVLIFCVELFMQPLSSLLGLVVDANVNPLPQQFVYHFLAS